MSCRKIPRTYLGQTIDSHHATQIATPNKAPAASTNEAEKDCHRSVMSMNEAEEGATNIRGSLAGTPRPAPAKLTALTPRKISLAPASRSQPALNPKPALMDACKPMFPPPNAARNALVDLLRSARTSTCTLFDYLGFKVWAHGHLILGPSVLLERNQYKLKSSPPLHLQSACASPPSPTLLLHPEHQQRFRV